MASQPDPWPELTEEEIAKEARENRGLHIRLGLIFQNAKEEIFEQWCEWDEWLSGKETEKEEE